MIIYDLTRQTVVSTNAIFFALSFVCFGLFALLLSIYKPLKKKNFFFNILSIEQFKFENKFIIKAIWIISFIIAIIVLGIELKTFLYVNHINWFEKVKIENGKITKVESSNLMGVRYEKVIINGKKFIFVRDSRYISDRNLMVNDSISIKIVDNSKEVILIKLINP